MIAFRPLTAVKQKFSVILSGRRCTFTFWYNQSAERWTFDMSLDGEPILHGRLVVTGVDLIKPFRLGIGVIFAWSPNGDDPDREALMDGRVRLYHATQEEFDAAVS